MRSAPKNYAKFAVAIPFAFATLGAAACGGEDSPVFSGSSAGASSGSSQSGAAGAAPAGMGGANTVGAAPSSAGSGPSTAGGAPSSGGGGSSTIGGTSSGGSAASGGTGGGSTCDATSGLKAISVLHVTPSGSAAADGSNFQSALDLTTALQKVTAGQLVLLEPGVYAIPYVEGQANTSALSKVGTPEAPIMLAAANCGRAVIDFSFPEQTWVQDSFGFHVTGSYWIFKGIEVTRAGYQGVYVTGSHNTFDSCAFYDNRNTGLEINKGGSYTTVVNCDAYRNYDPKKGGSMADGFGPKQTQGPGNVFIGCRAWENSDDGFDAFDSPEVVVIEKSWAFRNGVDVWNYGGFTGNGNGFKLGGNAVVAHNRITHSVAFGNPKKGFDQNNNAGGVTVLNCTGYQNGTNFGFGNPVSSGEKHTFRNNVSLSGAVAIANAEEQTNSWSAGLSASDADFQSLDLTQATVARRPDGSLPDTPLFRLSAQSALINAGTDVGLPFSGSAPDLGAFEKPN